MEILNMKEAKRLAKEGLFTFLLTPKLGINNISLVVCGHFYYDRIMIEKKAPNLPKLIRQSRKYME